MVVRAFVSSRLDYCNSLLCGIGTDTANVQLMSDMSPLALSRYCHKDETSLLELPDAETPVGAECRCLTEHKNWKTGAHHTGSPGTELVSSSTAHWLQASCSCAQGVTRPASTVPGWRLLALDRHQPPITAIGWCLDVCHKKNTNASRRQFFRRWNVSLVLSTCRITWQRYLTCTV